MAKQKKSFARTLLGQEASQSQIPAMQSAAAKAAAEGRSQMAARAKMYAKTSAYIAIEKLTGSAQGARNTNLLARAARGLGYEGAGDFIDKWFVKDKDYEPESKDASKVAKKVATDATRAVDVYSKSVMKRLDTMNGTLIRVDNNVGLLASVVENVSGDVSQIKEMLSPKDVTTRNEEGGIEFGQFNPLAPAGAQFLMYDKKKLDSGEVERGKLTGKPLENIQDAIQQAAIQTAIIARKMEREDEEKAELKRKREEYLARYQDPEERKKTNPCECLKEEMKKYNKLFDALQGENEQEVKGGLSWIERIAIFFGTFGKYLMPFLRFMLKFGRLGLVGFAAWVGWEIGKIIRPYVMEWIGKGWEKMKELWVEWGMDKAWDKVMNWGSELKATIHEFFQDMILKFMPKSDWAKEIRDERAKRLSDEDLAAAKAMSSRSEEDLWNNIDFIREQLADPNVSDEERANMMRVKEMYLKAVEEKRRQRGGVYPIDRGGLDTKETMADVIRDAARATQADYATLMAMAQQESGFDPNAATDRPGQTASGLFGMTNGTYNSLANRYGDRFGLLKHADKNDPAANALAAAILMREHEAAFREAGITPNPRNLYAAHMLGIGGAKKLINADPDMAASELYSDEVVQNNRPTFFKDSGRGEARTVGELQDYYGTIMDPAVSHYRRIDGNTLEGESVEVATAHRGGKGENVVTAPLVVNRPIERAAPPVAVRMPTTPVVSQDPSLLGSATKDAHPSLA